MQKLCSKNYVIGRFGIGVSYLEYNTATADKLFYYLIINMA